METTTGAMAGSAAAAEPFLRVAACSYEGSLFGWSITENEQNPQSGLLMDMTFGFNCCQSSLRAIAVSQSGKYLACAGMDERIRIFNVVEGRSVGEMSNHSGVINCLHFVGDTYLFSGSEDSTVSIWRVYDCVCLHILGGHKGSVLDIAVHPSGKLALTTSKDSTIKMWNLVQGRCAFTRRLKAPGDKICWDPSGTHYLVVSGMRMQVLAASDNSCKFEISLKSRINRAVFTSVTNSEVNDGDCRVAVVCENKLLYLYRLDGQEVCSISIAAFMYPCSRDLPCRRHSWILAASAADHVICMAVLSMLWQGVLW
jgi:protein MAK11